MQPTVDLRDVWRRHQSLDDPQARDRLITHFAYLVKITAGRLISNLPPSMERDDLYTAGIMGLIKAVDQFDLGRQVKFETYAIALIRGAILEMLREDDWAPRRVRELMKQLERTAMALEIELRRPATDIELAKAMEMTTEDLQKILVETGRASLLSLDDILGSSNRSEDGDLTLGDVIQDPTALPTFEAEIKERKHLLGKAVSRLPERERMVVTLYYYEGSTFKEIGKILTISESRVYQLHGQAVIRLRGYLQRDVELYH
ncbi:MAG: FliA/WhiG family RNA polymerase sigma factor [Chthonomonadaceae bacterium]|nr:FliA/WhiG family RNA polymerase sigma factor [Chthonomonadaceae bacterium]